MMSAYLDFSETAHFRKGKGLQQGTFFCLWFSCFNTSWENWQSADTPQLWVPFVYTVRLLQFEFTSNIKKIKAA